MRIFVSAFIVMSMLFSACEKESTENNTSNFLRYDGNETKLTQAIVHNGGEYVGFDESYDGYHMIFGVYSSEVNIVAKDGAIDNMLGTGSGAEFEVFASNPENISIQPFELASKYEINTFSFAVVYSEFNFETGSFIDGMTISDGTLTVNLINNELTLKSTLTLHPSGEIVTISYKGAYTYSVPE